MTNLLKRAKIQKTYRISRVREGRYSRHGTDHKRGRGLRSAERIQQRSFPSSANALTVEAAVMKWYTKELGYGGGSAILGNRWGCFTILILNSIRISLHQSTGTAAGRRRERRYYSCSCLSWIWYYCGCGTGT